MKRVLIIVHSPRVSTRIEGLVKYLPEFYWQPVILTGVKNKYTDLPARIVETTYRDALGFLRYLLKLDPEKDVKQQIKNRFGITSKKSPVDFFFTLGGEIINYPCPGKNWKPFALKAAREFLQTENIDAVISSSPPVVSHLISSELKTEHNIPWIADFRDLWSQNHNYKYSPLRKAFDKRLELKTLSQVDALTTTSQPWAEQLGALHKGKPVYTITHGFNPADANIPPAKLTTKFTINYTGIIYPGKQDTSKLFAALRDLISSGTICREDIEIRFYGVEDPWLQEETRQYGVSDIVNQLGKVTREVAVQKQRESQLLLLLDWDDPQERGVYTGKIFEYLGSRRPILAIGGARGNIVAKLLDETMAGIHAPTIEDVKNALKELYREYKLKGAVIYKGDEVEINKYSHREMARKFSEILEHQAQG
ncbi:glycosyltransferase [Chloroflexota bacterium]